MFAIIKAIFTDTERIYTEVMSKIGAKYGKKFTWEIKVKMMGMPSLKSAEKAVEEMELPITAEQFLEEAKIHKQELFPQCNMLPGKFSVFLFLKLFLNFWKQLYLFRSYHSTIAIQGSVMVQKLTWGKFLLAMGMEQSTVVVLGFMLLEKKLTFDHDKITLQWF